MKTATNRQVLKSSRHLHDPEMTMYLKRRDPNEYQDGSSAIQCGIAECPFGEFFIVVTPDGVATLELTEGNGAEMLKEFRCKRGYSWMTRDDGFAEAMNQIVCGNLQIDEFSVCVSGTPFQIEVWAALMDIPFGETVTYSELARRIGRPTAVRAVASAVAKNKIAYLIPCHRVVRSDGTVGKFRWGSARKKQMIEWEKANKDIFPERFRERKAKQGSGCLF